MRKWLLATHAGCHDAFDKVLLCQDIDDQDRHQCGSGGCHQHRPVGRELALEGDEPDRNRAKCVCVRDDQRPQEVVPGAQEREDAKSRQRRPHQRQRDREEDAEGAAAVDLRRVFQIVRYRQEALTHHERAEHAEHLRHEQSLVRVDPAEILHQDERRNDRDFARHHQGAQIEQEQQVAPRKFEAGKRIPGQR